MAGQTAATNPEIARREMFRAGALELPDADVRAAMERGLTATKTRRYFNSDGMLVGEFEEPDWDAQARVTHMQLQVKGAYVREKAAAQPVRVIIDLLNGQPAARLLVGKSASPQALTTTAVGVGGESGPEMTGTRPPTPQKSRRRRRAGNASTSGTPSGSNSDG